MNAVEVDCACVSPPPTKSPDNTNKNFKREIFTNKAVLH